MSIPPDQDAIFRAQHVGGSEVSALFGCNPWLTEFELWHRKKGSIATPEFNAMKPDGTPENERIFWGVKLEAAIIEAAKLIYGYVDREDTGPLSNGEGLGGHPDRAVTCPQRGPIILETKMVDKLEFKKWGDEPPTHYLLQGNTYAGLDYVNGFDMLVLVGGNKLERIQYDFRPKLFTEAERRVKAFWQSVHENKPPKPDYGRDGDTVAALFNDPADSEIDLTGDNLASDAAHRWLTADRDVKDATARRDAARAELLDKIGNNLSGRLEGMIVRAPLVKGTPPSKITKEMVGQVVKGRAAFRRFGIKELEN